MCDYSKMLIAWLDRELEPEEMAAVQQHLPNCDECRSSVSKYEGISRTLDEYCQTMMIAPQSSHTRRRWVPILSAAAAILVFAATTAIVWRSRVHSPNSVPTLFAPTISAIHSASTPEPTALPHPKLPARKAPHTHPRNSPAAIQQVTWVPPQPALEVAIPADSMFPPGAVPQGINFVADVNFAPDGSARQMRLRPRLTAVERSVSQP